ncbi:NAD(P)-dependent oxidoreductase [Quadrisphaera setariae]|uniref:NAD(P)-dependent oxidoreductase n=1 Tax=Quadrisphaera setariae TaxID=2593304 RepID=A0A5C8ZG53_9ACTN|nr:NAD(P)-dependent oxidoreductase [Quadrisphaera setariae]
MGHLRSQGAITKEPERGATIPGVDDVRVGFAGLGIMGAPMAGHLLRAGVPLTVWNRSPAPALALEAAGARRAVDVLDLFERSDVVVLMPANADALDDVLAALGDRRSELLAGRTVVNTGTVAPERSRALPERVSADGGVLVEAPVSGSRRPAEEAALVGMTAGARDAVERVTPLLRHFCASTTFCGEVPAALTTKLAVNTFLIALMTGLAESFHFAAAHGLDPTLLREVLDSGQVSSPISRVKSAELVDQDWAPRASLADVLMNASLMTDAARAAGIASPLLDVCRDLCAEGVERGDGGLDVAAVVRTITDRSARESVPPPEKTPQEAR